MPGPWTHHVHLMEPASPRWEEFVLFRDYLIRHPDIASAYADLNGDGKIDVVVTCLGEPAEIWENVSPDRNHWIILRLAGARSNREGIGARLRIGEQHNQMTTAVGYASSSDAGVHFGLGAVEKIPKVEIRWPSGTVQMLTDVKPDQVLTVREPSATGGH